MQNTVLPNTVLPKQQYKVVIELDAPIEQCFLAACREDAMMHWVPKPRSIIYDHSKSAEPYGGGSVRTITLMSGFSLVEKIQAAERPTRVSYCVPSFGNIGDRFLKNYQVSMHFEAIDAKHTRLTWAGYFDCNGLQKIFEPLLSRAFNRLIVIMANNMRNYLST